jgi:pimeloyl-ACP methyl ester carboxylesterase
MAEAKLIDQISTDKLPHYEPFGWHHWPDFPWMSYQFRRALGETQEGGGAISECFLAASRMIPGDHESWHVEMAKVADQNAARGDEEEAKGHIRTAMNCWLRAADHYRSAEFWLKADDPRRLATFDKCEAASHKFLAYCVPKGEAVEIPYENGKTLFAYFIRAPYNIPRQPVLIAFGGLDSFKDELWFMVGRGALQRGISVLMVDGPGQGGTLRRHKIPTRYDYEVPVGRCIDWLEKRDDVDAKRIAVSGSSLGGYYAARAGAKEPRLAAAISHGAIWDIYERWKERDDSHGLAGHIRWVFGAKSMAEATEISKPFKLEGVLDSMKCPYLICHGGHDVLGVQAVTQVHDYAKKCGIDVTLRLTTAEETGAEHCQHDNPTLGQEIMLDWLADRFGIDQRSLKNSQPLAA